MVGGLAREGRPIMKGRKLRPWGRFPSEWVNEKKLKDLKWSKFRAQGGAGLRLYLILAHRLQDDEDGIVHASYDELMTAANLSRQSVSDGLDCLGAIGVIDRGIAGRGSYQFCDYDPEQGWAQVPALPLYNGSNFQPFMSWTMRNRAEFDAMKLYLWFAARRDTDENQSFTTYKQIKDGTGVPTGRISAGISLLVSSGLVAVTSVEVVGTSGGNPQAYRLKGLNTRAHPGTRGHAKMNSIKW